MSLSRLAHLERRRRPRWSASILVVLALCLASGPLAGQDTASSPPVADRWPQRSWIDAGLGGGTWPQGSLAGIAAVWYSVGPVVTGARRASAGQIFGEQRSDQAFLIGGRTRGTHAFLLGAVGRAKVASWRECDGPCTAPPPRPGTTALAYTFEAHANLSVVGLGVVMFGVIGPDTTRYNAIALTLSGGWFGR
jgi:hypothetical protein